jgi:meso-butanediol dehydrogenase / (S,S)-butanediol dehydrogenase / diacetyl reductase
VTTPDLDAGQRIAVVSLGPAEQLQAVEAALAKDGWVVATLPPSLAGRGRDEDFVARFAAENGRIDLLVAGPTHVLYGDLESAEPAVWWSNFDAGAGHAFRMARASAAALTASRGSIIFVTSQAGIRGAPMASSLSASSGAIVGLTRALAWELAPVRVNAVAAGLVDEQSELDALAHTASTTPDAIRSSSAGMTLLGRLASHQDIAGAVAFLASSQASYFTGEVIEPNGGRTQR